MIPESVRMPPPTCPECGRELPADAAWGFCPQCLLGAALSPQAEALEPRAAEPVASADAGATPGIDGSIPRRFGDYELLSMVAHGGMGIVYRARQLSLERLVAVKMLLFGRSAAADDVARFQREAQAAANLHHPNIVAIHEVGKVDGQHFFSMELVAGQTLAELARGGLPALRAARYVQTISGAVDYAHGRGVLHRDLKPSNVLIDERDQPRITDFGLAKRASDNSELTHTGQMLGSPGYIPPEQAGGGVGRVGPWSDVYSLGAILYYLLTGRPPFVAERLEDTLLQVLHAEPISPRTLNPSLPWDLETICLKCLEKDSHRRYPTAQELADDLSRFLDGKPVLARRVGAAGKALRWCRRKPLVAGLTLALIVVFAVGLAGVLVQWRRARASEALTRQNLYDADMNLAGQALEEQNIGLALKHLEAHLPKPGEEDLRGWEWRYFRRQCRGEELATLGRHGLSAQSVAFSPDGRLLGSAGEDCFKLWDVGSRREIASGVHTLARVPSARSRILFSPAGGLVATSGIDHAVRLWSLTPLRPAGELLHDGMVSGVAFSADGALLATVNRGPLEGDGESRVRANIWDVASRSLTAELPVPDAWAIALSPDGTIAAIGEDGGGIVLWEHRSGAIRRKEKAHAEDLREVAFSPDGEILASAGASDDKTWTVRCWDPETLQETARFSEHTGWIVSLAFSAHGRILASASADRTVRLWDLIERREVTSLRGHRDEVWGVAFSPDGQLLASSAKDGEVKLWKAAPVEKRTNSLAFPGAGCKCVLSPAGDALLIGTRDETLQIWDTNGPRQMADYPALVNGLSFAAIASGGRTFATLSTEGKLVLWRKGEAGAEPLAVLAGQPRLGPLGFAHDGKQLAGAAGEGSIRLWEAATLRELARFEAHHDSVLRLTFSRDDSLLAVAFTDWTVEVWDCQAARRRATLAGHRGAVVGIAIAAGGRTVATTSYDATAKLWDLQTGKAIGTLEGQLFALYSVALSNDGRRLAVGGADGTIKLWDIALQRTVGTLRGHARPVRTLRFLPDGDALVSLCEDKLMVWRAEPAASAPGE